MPACYAVRARVPRDLADAWRAWLVEEHLARVVATGWFTEGTPYEIDGDDPSCREFLVLYNAPDRHAINQYLVSDACRTLRAEGIERFGDAVAYTREIWSAVVV